MKQFVLFPFSLYKHNPYWVPPIVKDEIASFDPAKNPVFQNAEAQFFIAFKNGKIVGRVAAIINWIEVEKQQLKKMRFGWFDVIDDLAVSKILLNKVKEIGLENNLLFMEGPVGFNNLDKTGILTDGFEHIGTMITWYNPPYYKVHLEQLGFVKEKEYLENKFAFKNVDALYFNKWSTVVKKRYQLSAMEFTKTKDLLPYLDDMFDLLEKSYGKLATFVPISKVQIAYFKKKYLRFINPEYLKFVVDANNKLVAFALVMPSFSKALQKANGTLFPFGLFYLLQAKKQAKDVIFYLIGVDPAYQNKGIHAILFDQYAKTFSEKGIVNCIRTPELANNTAIQKIWKNVGPITHKKRSTYKKILSEKFKK